MIKTRYPPSPTGFWHIGQARTALFNYLFAKKNKGKLVFRFEDTDKERSKKEFENNIIAGMEWLGLKWDEGPYRQTERIEIYAKYLKQLLDENKAYYCFCSEEELEAQRSDMESRGVAPKYSGKCANLSSQEIEENFKKSKNSVIRFRMPAKKIKFKDLIRGFVEFDGDLIGDFVIAKNINEPLYNLAVVIDDYEMGISHIIRGEDILSSTPKQIAILEALGVGQAPYFAHLPLILNPDRSKMSKRHFATAVDDYKKQGYLPEAMINFVALLGWNPGNNQEIFSLAELEEIFDLAKVQKSGAVFNIEKLNWFNSYYIKQKTGKELAELCRPYWQESGLIKHDVDIEWLSKVAKLFQERLKTLGEICEISGFIFVDLPEYSKELLKWKNSDWEVIKDNLEFARNFLAKIDEKEFTSSNFNEIMMPEVKNRGVGETLWPLRVALSGLEASPGPFDILEVLGKEKSLKRIDFAISKI